ncbi:hypothetical protein FNV43_RR15486 [Rhamnella rubrinervis]|uniref:Uncharacterized protein n=1 Tax=Rhamnella rubrinervis TaxID=2594499 RepID=A0A8K0E1M6_9ROSA|nr:hypothetical protein FNV43_RR15486 [Rhamnella rubrinervis]
MPLRSISVCPHAYGLQMAGGISSLLMAIRTSFDLIFSVRIGLGCLSTVPLIGFGSENPVTFNKAFLSKLAWKLMNKDSFVFVSFALQESEPSDIRFLDRPARFLSYHFEGRFGSSGSPVVRFLG